MKEYYFMENKIKKLITQFKNKKILIIGDAMLDIYLKGSTNRICREAPVPIVVINKKYQTGGGAANTAINLSSLGAKVQFISVVGTDSESKQLQGCLRENNVSTEHLILDEEKQTLAKERIVASGQILVRFDLGNGIISKKAEKSVIKKLELLYPTADAILISDYDYGVLTPLIIKKIEKLQKIYKKIIAVDSKRLKAFARLSPTVIKPNYTEAVSLLNLPVENSDTRRVTQIAKHGQTLQKKMNAAIAAITLDTAGALVFSKLHDPYRTYAIPHEHANAAGAGDTYISAFTLSIASKSGVPLACETAALATEAIISKQGTSICTPDDILSLLSPLQGKIIENRTNLKKLITLHKSSGKKIIFTNGCFDILHPGHVNYLAEAKKRGDILIVGVNTDTSIKKIKGPTRPINTLEDRLSVLSALECIDYLISFPENTPLNLIRIIKPYIYIKGGDYTRETLPETPLVEKYGGKVEIIPFLVDRSTTKIINKIKSNSLKSHEYIQIK